MKRLCVLIALLVAAAVLPTAALAHRRATKAEQSAVLAAVVRQHELSRAQAACQVVTISTVSHNYAAVKWPEKLSRACMRVAANGVIIEHRQARGWHFVTVGSTFRCPIKGVPTRVAHDLRVCF
jgi:type II secretory pathway pseudopilin PulG